MPDDLQFIEVPYEARRRRRQLQLEVGRGVLLQSVPRARSLFEHSDRNVRTGKTFMSADGSQVHSTLSITVNDRRLNGGRATLIPTVYDGKALTQDKAIARAVKSKKKWPSFESTTVADEWARGISNLMTDSADTIPEMPVTKGARKSGAGRS